MARITYRAGAHVRPQEGQSHLILAADFGTQATSQAEPTAKVQHNDDTQPEQDHGDRDEELRTMNDADQEAQPPPTRQSYTAPSAEVRQAALAPTGSADDDEEYSTSFGDAGREAAEATVGGSASFVGQPGLSALQPTVAGVVVSRPGLQEGPASGLGFASSFNILTPRSNPLSGANGRCTDLIRAGFFGGSQTTCEVHFRRP